MYSSKHTTHSTCLPIYFFHSLDTLAIFSCSGTRGGIAGTGNGAELTRMRSLGSGIPVVVRDRGRDLVLVGGDCCSSGVVTEELVGFGNLGD